MEPRSSSYLLPASIIVAAVLISGSIIYLVGASKTGTGNTGKYTADVAANASESFRNTSSNDVILGDPKAPVTLIEYGDYQCPFCGRMFSQVEPRLRDEYIKTGKVKMVFRNFQFLGTESVLAAEAAACAKEQGKFWAYRDATYQAEIKDGIENNGNLNRNLFVALAKNVGLDVEKFSSCYDSGKYENQIKQETSDAASLGVNSTPTNFVNGQVINGAQPYEQFQSAIENALKGAK